MDKERFAGDVRRAFTPRLLVSLTVYVALTIPIARENEEQ